MKNFCINGGVICDENGINKCDWLLVINDGCKTAVFVELKGKNINHALEQLYDTAVRYKSTFDDYKKVFRIVCTGAPKIGNDPKMIKKKEQIFKQFGSLPCVKENSFDEKRSDL